MKGHFLLSLLVLIFLSFTCKASDFSCQQVLEEREVNQKTFQYCQNKYSWYPQPIRFVLLKSSSSKDVKNIVLYFHGHHINGFAPFYDKSLKNSYADFFNFYLNAYSNKSPSEIPVLVLPESLGSCATYDQFFKLNQNAALFFSSLRNFFPSALDFHLSGHSGAYRSMNQLSKLIMQNTLTIQIRSIGLFDAVYASMPDLMNLIKRQKNNSETFLYFNSYVTGNKQSAQKYSSIQSHDVKTLIDGLPGKMIYVHRPLSSRENETLLEQHFRLLERASYTDFLKLIK